jgi:hypothetical protein
VRFTGHVLACFGPALDLLTFAILQPCCGFPCRPAWCGGANVPQGAGGRTTRACPRAPACLDFHAQRRHHVAKSSQALLGQQLSSCCVIACTDAYGLENFALHDMFWCALNQPCTCWPVPFCNPMVAFRAGRHGEAEQMHRKVLESRQHVLGPVHPDTLASMNNLAITLHAQGKR